MNNNDNEGVLNMAATVQKWGNSLGVRIPKRIAEQLNIVNGSKMEFVIKDNEIILKPVKKEVTLEELLAQCTPENRHEEIDFGGPVGREFW